MGKTGGRELNYLSDVDVIFVYDCPDDADDHAAVQEATRLAAAVMKLCREHTGEGTIWEVDANLRPEGKAGPLVRSLASHVAYYERWATTWEFQALLKARFAAGDEEQPPGRKPASDRALQGPTERGHNASQRIDVRAVYSSLSDTSTGRRVNVW